MDSHSLGAGHVAGAVFCLLSSLPAAFGSDTSYGDTSYGSTSYGDDAHDDSSASACGDNICWMCKIFSPADDCDDDHGDDHHVDTSMCNISSVAEWSAKTVRKSEAICEEVEYGIVHGDHGGHSHLVDEIIMILLTGVVFGITLNWLCTHTFVRKFEIPYTLGIFVMGVFVSFMAGSQTVPDKSYPVPDSPAYPPFIYDWPIAQAIRSTQNIDAHIILLIILPPLIYEASSHMNYHVFKRVSGTAALLAFPGMIIGLCSTAVFSRYAFQSQTEPDGQVIWEWPTAFCLASIVSATDPVAVVAALHELGAPEKLASIIDGESLLNDGSAMVMFTIFLDVLGGEEFDLGNAILLFIQLAGGGAIWGMVAYNMAHMVLVATEDNWKVEVPVLFFGIYGTFAIGERALGVSSVLAVVVFGVQMARRGKFAVSPEVDAMAEHFIHVVGQLSETAIFFIAGVVTWTALKNSNDLGQDCMFNIALYIALHLIRGSMLAMFMPLMQRMGYGLNWKELTIIAYGGLRGAIGLSLALLVQVNPNVDSSYKNKIMFHTAGIVMLTMLVNGTTCPALYRALKIYPANKYRTEMVKKAMQELEGHDLDECESELKEDWFYESANWDAVYKLVPSFNDVHVNEDDNGLVLDDALYLNVNKILKDVILPEYHEKSAPGSGKKRSSFHLQGIHFLADVGHKLHLDHLPGVKKRSAQVTPAPAKGGSPPLAAGGKVGSMSAFEQNMAMRKQARNGSLRAGAQQKGTGGSDEKLQETTETEAGSGSRRGQLKKEWREEHNKHHGEAAEGSLGRLRQGDLALAVRSGPEPTAGATREAFVAKSLSKGVHFSEAQAEQAGAADEGDLQTKPGQYEMVLPTGGSLKSLKSESSFMEELGEVEVEEDLSPSKEKSMRVEDVTSFRLATNVSEDVESKSPKSRSRIKLPPPKVGQGQRRATRETSVGGPLSTRGTVNSLGQGGPGGAALIANTRGVSSVKPEEVGLATKMLKGISAIGQSRPETSPQEAVESTPQEATRRKTRRIALTLPTQKWSIFEQEEEIASTLFEALGTEYHHQYMAKELDDDALYFLDEALNKGKDYLADNRGATINQALKTQLDFLVELLPIPIPDWLLTLEETPIISGFAQRMIFHRVYSSLEALSGFIRAHQGLIHLCEMDGRLVEPEPVIMPVIQGAQYEISQMEADFGTLMHVQRIVLTARVLAQHKKSFTSAKCARGLLIDSDVEKLTGCLDRVVTKLQAVRFSIEIAASCRKYHKDRHGTRVSLA